ncbi:MAG: hypothetical protein UW15_C0030G0018, partial [Parcubacteria group bacterium GW2011_GWC1_44_10]
CRPPSHKATDEQSKEKLEIVKSCGEAAPNSRGEFLAPRQAQGEMRSD